MKIDFDELFPENGGKSSCHFQLDQDIVSVIKGEAKRRGRRKSEIVNSILRKVLFEEPEVIEEKTYERDKKEKRSYTETIQEMNEEECLRELGNFLRFCRLEKGLSQKQTAEIAGISQPFYSQIEAGKKRVPVAMMLRLIYMLDAELADFEKYLFK